MSAGARPTRSPRRAAPIWRGPGSNSQSESAERGRLEEKIRALESEEAALRSEFEWRATEHAEALAAVREQLQKETLERIQAEEENETLRREIAHPRTAPAEADARIAEALQSADPIQRELAGGREAQSLNKVLRKKLTELRHAAQQAQIERAALAQQVQSQAAALEKARVELQQAKEENRQLRQSLAEALDDGPTLDQAKKSADEPAKPGEAAAKTEESWTQRLFSSRKNPPAG